MHRLLADTATLGENYPSLGAEAIRHLKVLRPEDGEDFELFDGRGAFRICRWDAASRRLTADGDVCHEKPPKDLVLFACVTKGSRWDWTIEKATELGVTRIVPVISERTIVRLKPSEREPKRERWLRIAEDAARQSDARWIPDILVPLDFCPSLDLVRGYTCFVGALTRPMPADFLTAFRKTPRTNPPAVFVGPEGDFTPGELASLLAIATPVSFGRTILRAETAAIYGASVLKAALYEECAS